MAYSTERVSNTFYGYQDNRINGNGTDIVGMLNNSRALK